MKPIPDIDNAEAMIARGKASALMSARKDATETLRDSLLAVQSADWPDLSARADVALRAADRLKTLALLWETSGL